MRDELAILLSIAIGAAGASTARSEPQSRAQTDFAAAVEARAADDLRSWTAAHEGEAFGRTRSIAIALLAARSAGDTAGAEARRAELAFVAGALEALEPAAELARCVLAWSAADFEAFDALRGEVEEARGAFERGDADSAWPRVERVLAAAQPPGAIALLNKPLSDFAKLAAGLAPVERVRGLVEVLLASAEDARDAPWVAWYAEWLGQIEWSTGRLGGASGNFERAIETRRTLGHGDAEAAIRANLALVRLSLGDLEGGLANAERAEELARALGDRALVRTAAHARATGLFDLGELEAALALLTRIDAEGRERDAVQLRLDMLRAGLLQDVGRLESARTWAERALELAGDEKVRAEAPNLRGEALLSAGLLFGDLREFDRALATLDEAQRFFEAVGDPRGVAWTRKNRGWVLLDRGEPAAAQAEFERALAYERAEGKLERSLFLEGWCELGRAESASRRDPGASTEEVDAWLRAAETCAVRLHDRHLRARVWTLRGTRWAARGDDLGALGSFHSAVQQIERLRARLSSPGLLTHFLRDKVDPFRQGVLAAARLGDGELALTIAESSRARVLFEQRARSELAAADSVAGARVQAARRALAQAESLLRAEPALPAHARGVADAERELDAALLEAELAAPRAARLLGSPRPSLDFDRIAGRLRAGPFDTAVEYVLGETASVAIVVRARESELQIDLALLPVGEREIAGIVARLRAPIEALARGELDLAHLGFDVAAARAAHAALIAPIAGMLGERVAIVPDGCLWSAPFECFVTGGDARRVDPERPFAHLRGLRFWIEERTVGFLPSVSVLAEPPRPGAASGIVAIAPPAGVAPTSAAAEIEALRSLGASFGELRVCDAADPASIERDASAARWLDFVAHGRFDARFPASSHLVIGADEKLAAWEIERWRIGARLAVLSACHGGEGPLAAGEGALGLARSFLVAGAEEVVASLWAVEDRATSELMLGFWSEVARGADPLDALRRAKLASIASDDPRGFARAHPYFWAGWCSLRGGG